MARKNSSLLHELSYLPWWVSAILGMCVYAALKFVFPNMDISNPYISAFTAAAQNVAWVFGGMFLIPSISSIFKNQKRKKLITQQASIQTLKDTSWSDFEMLVGEAFRRKGFSVQENRVGGADGGIDLSLHKDGKLHLVQCKQWRNSKVGVAIVREMFGVMTAANAESVYVVCSGHFTNDAIKFAQGLPIELINGEQLLDLIADVQTNPPAKKPVTTEVIKFSKDTHSEKLQEHNHQCPKCTSLLVKRTARKGPNAGNEFWGCSSFPQCRYIQQ